MKSLFVPLALLFSVCAAAQRQTFDLLSFVAPAGWKKEVQQNQVVFTRVDNAKKTWGQIGVIKSTVSQGSLDADFDSEWKGLVVERYKVTAPPEVIDEHEEKGWKFRSATGTFRFNNSDAYAILCTMSGFGRCVSVVANSNSQDYLQAITNFLESVDIKKPAGNTPANTGSTQPGKSNSGVNNPPKQQTPAAPGRFQFTTSNFDDGWTSVVREDWVEVTKGNIRVLLHYPREEEKKYYPQQDEHTRTFWNLLVAPRYSNLTNFELMEYNMSYEPGRFAAGNLVEPSTGRTVYVVLFSKAKSGWIEIITPDKNTFVQAFGIQNPDANFYDWEPLTRLSGYNKFAVGENDLAGKWTTDFTAVNSLYNVYTGAYAGAHTYTSSSSFEFSRGRTYKWNLVMASGTVGGMKVDRATAAGTWKLLNNWQVWFSEIERKPRTYNAYFSCIKGGRLLWLQDTGYGSFTAYGLSNK